MSDVRVTKGLARLDVITDGLAQVDLFSGLSRRDLAGIARSGQAVDHRPGKEVVAEGRRGIAFHLILEGSADLGIGGRVRGRLEAGGYFGEMSLLGGRPRTATVRAGSADVCGHRVGVPAAARGASAGRASAAGHPVCQAA